MAILYGTTSGGDVLPVQVDQAGRLVAEGLDGAPGPEGPQGPQGPEGPNVLLPYGEENAYLVIQNGVPTWTKTPVPPDPPPPLHDVMVVDDRQVVRTDIENFGVYNDLQDLFDPHNDWDEACRSLPVWSKPSTKQSGIGGQGRSGKYYFSFPVKFNIHDALGKVIQFTFASRMNHTYGSAYGTYYAEVQTQDTNFTPITVDERYSISTASSRVSVFSYYINKPDFTEAEFTFIIRGGSSSYGYPVYGFLQKWEIVESGTFMMNHLLKASDKEIRKGLLGR